ncbi:energy transducer TonB family protein [Shimia sp.]|uniref:energy transducer TonB family protein n=1 Tax=Shimia sp. TaxID=1954381 RepID=UPI003B8B9F14
MRTFLEILMFAAMAVGLHLSFLTPPDETGLVSAGDGGDDLLQMMASNASIKTMVQTWDSPPQATDQVESPVAPAPPTTQPAVHTPPAPKTPTAPNSAAPQFSMPVASHDAPPLPVLPPAPASIPETDMAPAAPQQVPSEPILDPQTASVPDTPQTPTPPPKLEITADHTPQSPPTPPSPAPPAPPKPPQPTPTPTPPKTTTAQSSQASIQVEARKASGSGGKTAKGDNGQAEVATKSNAKQTSLMRKWGSQVRARVAQRSPKGAGKGTAVIRVTVSGKGDLLAAKLVKSSGNDKIDRLALSAVKNVKRLPKAPKGLSVGQQSFDIPIASR